MQFVVLGLLCLGFGLICIVAAVIVDVIRPWKG